MLTLRLIWISAGALAAAVLAAGHLTSPTARPVPAAPLVAVAAQPAPRPPIADSVVALGLRLRGTGYQAGGTTPAVGFDCSGFVRYCFGQRGVAVPPSSRLQALTGRHVPRAEARPGDIIIFAGTEAGACTPGHTGLVISQPGEVLRFVHSSSARHERGVKVSQVDLTGYEARFLDVRRVIEATPAGWPPPVAAPVAALKPVALPVAQPVVVSTLPPPPEAARAPRVRTTRHRVATRPGRRIRPRAAKPVAKKATKPTVKKATKPTTKKVVKPAVKKTAKPATKKAAKPAAKKTPKKNVVAHLRLQRGQ